MSARGGRKEQGRLAEEEQGEEEEEEEEAAAVATVAVAARAREGARSAGTLYLEKCHR